MAKGKRLGTSTGPEVVNLRRADADKDPHPSYMDECEVRFSVKVDELQLDWSVRFTAYGDKTADDKLAWIWVSSPNKRGTFDKKLTGRNATAEASWKMINEIYNGKYKR